MESSGIGRLRSVLREALNQLERYPLKGSDLPSFLAVSPASGGLLPLVVAALALPNPLSLSEVHGFVRAAGCPVSCQAVFKVLKSLSDKKIVRKEARLYSLNPVWLLQTGRQLLFLMQNYGLREETALQAIPVSDAQMVPFSSRPRT